MILEQHYLGCLSQASYLVGDERSGRAVVVDPHRDVDEYLDAAAAAGLTIEAVIETHFHADFVSGHLELAASTGATICYGPGASADYPIRTLADGERLELGDVAIEVRATPGHTPESISLVVYEGADAAPTAVLTGDTLFVGSVGRPDLLAAQGADPEDLARRLFRSVHDRLLVLPDDTRVLPGHGAGSSCGKQLSTETSSTIGQERRTNYALQPMSEDEFVHMVTDGQPTAPRYFPFSAHRNREQHDLLDAHVPPTRLPLDTAIALAHDGAALLDTRDPDEFAAGHLAGSINVGLGGRFAEYAGDVLRPGEPIVLVCDDDQANEARVRLARVGFDTVAGYVATPTSMLLDRPELSRRASRVVATELADLVRSRRDIQIVDVRNPGEVSDGAVFGAINVPLARLLDQLDEIDRDRAVVVYCAGGYRSSIAASVIRHYGHDDVSDLVGGYGAWKVLVGE